MDNTTRPASPRHKMPRDEQLSRRLARQARAARRATRERARTAEDMRDAAGFGVIFR
jgi:hypothetical protein